VAFGGWFCGCRKSGQEGKDIVGGYGIDLPVTERILKTGKK